MHQNGDASPGALPLVVEQPGDEQTLIASDVDRTFHPPRREGRDGKSGEYNRVRKVELRELGSNLDAQERVTDDLWREGELNAEFLPLDGDRRHAGGAWLSDRDRDLATRKETRRVIVFSHHLGLG